MLRQGGMIHLRISRASSLPRRLVARCSAIQRSASSPTVTGVRWRCGSSPALTLPRVSMASERACDNVSRGYLPSLDPPASLLVRSAG